MCLKIQFVSAVCPDQSHIHDEKYADYRNYPRNEFEVKLEELKSKIESGEIVIKDPETGEDITTINTTDYVYDNYFMKKNYDSDDELLLDGDV